MKTVVVAGIGTDVGKTVVSAIIVQATGADYWKPVQSGSLDNTDCNVVRRLTGGPTTRFHAEAYSLKLPASPHAAAAEEGVVIRTELLALPATRNNLVVELAGGLMVPLNDDALNIDLLKQWNASVVLVSRNYLGSINHTLLSIGALKRENIHIKGIIFNGLSNAQSEEAILRHGSIPCIARVGELQSVDSQSVKSEAEKMGPYLHGLFL